ncbi:MULTISPECIES: HNH endonuclease [Stenotrophomonas]|uniref:HNH endonuclease n=1 Tax=Stenotrophomonas TaxID=40323 RepID=UPI0007EDDFF1|nr:MULTISPECIES: HNH endonuclease [Stenotrophomonas]MCF3535774.1 HNH endonuclease [Stenotrophomonas maltophilia]
MAKAIFTSSEISPYRDLKEQWYHFSKNLLARVQETIGDWVIFYEPRRNSGPSSSGGAQAYVALARVVRIRPDPTAANYYFADLAEYIEFDHRVPFKYEEHYFESALRKADGSANKGAFGQSVRVIPDCEFHTICNLGFKSSLSLIDSDDRTNNADAHYPGDVKRAIATTTVSRAVRDTSFRKRVRHAYGNRCAFTGLMLLDRLGNPEVEAAHIRPVSKNGPDTVSNGIALTGTVHWMFDAGIVSIDEDHRILVGSNCASLFHLTSLFPDDGRVCLPRLPDERPHRRYLEWHRKKVFKSENLDNESPLELP